MKVEADLEGDMARKFNELKIRLGATKNSEVLRVLISRSHEIFQKKTLLPIDSAIYDTLEGIARQEGKTIHELAEGCLLAAIKKT
jgi:hypothetical protein